jgi:AraC-like DNA-binding protein
VSDALSDVLEAVRLTGALFFLVDASPPWIAEAPASAALGPVILPRAQHVVSYHVVIAGSCWCHMGDGPPVLIEPGEVIVVPHGDGYSLSSAPDIRSGFTEHQALEWFRAMSEGRLPLVVAEGGAGSPTLQLVCGFLGCDALPFNPVLAALPPLLHVGRHAAAESREPRPGSRTVLQRVGELMFVEVIRRYLTAMSAQEGGWLAGLRDPLVGRALAALHKAPSRAWTLDVLAREVAASRSVLSERFTHFVGEPPMHYLTRWRLQRAANLLTDRAAKISTIAREVGYESEAAFSRAFKKLTGLAPTAWRRRQADPPVGAGRARSRQTTPVNQF